MKIELIGFPMFYGSDRPGVEYGPDKLRENGLIELFEKNDIEVTDKGNIEVEIVGTDKKYKGHKTMKYLKQVVEGNERLGKAVEDALNQGKISFVIGGDHSLGLGSLAGVRASYKDDFAVIWIDAHADLNITESSPSGNIHGMPLGASAGLGDKILTSLYNDEQKVKPRNIYLIGLRSVDEGEELIIKEQEIKIWRMSDIRERGMDEIISELMHKLKNEGTKKIHISYDIDSLDMSLVPGTGTPVKDGLMIPESKKLLSAILQTGMVGSIDFVEFNPTIDKENKTLESCMSILETFTEELGKLQ